MEKDFFEKLKQSLRPEVEEIIVQLRGHFSVGGCPANDVEILMAARDFFLQNAPTILNEANYGSSVKVSGEGLALIHRAIHEVFDEAIRARSN